MRVSLFHNEKAGDEEWSSGSLLNVIRAAGHDAEVFTPDEGGILQGLRTAPDLVAIAGGDGTINTVAPHLIGGGIPLTTLPAGTANNISQSLGIDGPFEELIQGWTSARRQPFDVGLARGWWGEKLFFEALGFGLFAGTMFAIDVEEQRDESEFANSEEELKDDLKKVLDTLTSHEPELLEVNLDGTEQAGYFFLVEALNIKQIGPNLRLAPEADPSDGQLDLVLVQKEHLPELTNYISDRIAGRDSTPKLPVHRTRSLKIASPPSLLHIDDKLIETPADLASDTSQIEISVMPRALEFLVPSIQNHESP
jgi:diacylglycerol kinase (ATP)